MTTKVTFILPAEIAGNSAGGKLLGEFNNWNHAEAIELQVSADGSLFAEIELPAGKSYQYRYLLHDGRWVNDHNGKIAAEIHGQSVENCIVMVPLETAAAKKAVPKKTPGKTAPTKKPSTKKAAPAVADDLTRIEGISKKIAALLKKNGVINFAQLGKTSVKSLKAMLDKGGDQYKIHNPGSWPKQAKLATAGKWHELDALQSSLKGRK